jgi:hypothetical protein
MALTLHYASGSPYAWRVWLALEHKGIPYELKLLSFDKGDLATSAFRALNPRGRVPVIEDDGFALYESAAIVEYIEDKHPGEPRLFASDIRERALQRRMVREADQYFADPLERLVTAVLFTKAEDLRPSASRPSQRTSARSSPSGRRRSRATGSPGRCPRSTSRSTRSSPSSCAWRAATPVSSRETSWAVRSPPGLVAWRRCPWCKRPGRRTGSKRQPGPYRDPRAGEGPNAERLGL